MYTASDLRKGLKITIDGEPYIVTDFEFSKPGKGQALYRTRLKNLLTGNAFDRTFRSNDKFEKADLTERTMQFLYSQGDEYVFMDIKNYEQIHIGRENLEDKIPYLIDKKASRQSMNEVPGTGSPPMPTHVVTPMSWSLSSYSAW